MDQELVQYLDGRFQHLDERFERIDARFDRIEQRLDGHDGRFDSIEQRLDGHDRRFDSIELRLDGHDQRFEGIDRRFDSIVHRFDEVNQRFDEVKRHTGVLVEGLRHDVQLLAEGLDTFINVRYAQDQATIAEQFRETRALIHLSYDQLRQRVENLERRGQS
jgi:chromosome segregation ATPase